MRDDPELEAMGRLSRHIYPCLVYRCQMISRSGVGCSYNLLIGSEVHCQAPTLDALLQKMRTHPFLSQLVDTYTL
jgi:hypothetical protein